MDALGSHLFQVQRIFALHDADRDARIAAVATHSLERRQLLALAVSTAASERDDPHAHFLVVRSVEEDRRVRHWRFPLAASHAKQQQQRVEPVAALAFSPEGDWLACLSTRKNRIHLVPVATLIADHRRGHLARVYQPMHNREWMSVAPSVMTTPMASYLRAANEAGGHNGARYHSRVAGDDSQMSTLEFATGMGTVTCCRWWRSLNGKNYCLVGGSENIISFVNVEENAEECRCELQNAGVIESIELFYENFRKEKRTSMLVKTRSQETLVDGMGGTASSSYKYYRVVLEKKTHQKSRQATREGSTMGLDTADDSLRTRSGELSRINDADPSPEISFQHFVSRPGSTDGFVVKTFPEHFVEDVDFRPQRIKKNKPDVRLCAINGLLSSESGLAMYDAANHQISVYSNFQWSLKGQYTLPTLSSNDSEVPGGDRVADIDIAYCSSDLMLLRGTSAETGKPVSTWVSLPSRHLLDENQPVTSDEAHIVHYLSLHDGERVESVLQARTITSGDPASLEPAAGSGGEVIYVIQTAHNVYECRPQWSRLALFRALRGQTIGLKDALSIGYALGIDMASLCEVVADTICEELQLRCTQNHHGGRHEDGSDEDTLRWVHDLYQVSRAKPSKAVNQLNAVGGLALAVHYAKQFLENAISFQAEVESLEGQLHEDNQDKIERHRVSLQVVDLIFRQQTQHTFNSVTNDLYILRPCDAKIQDELDANEKWLIRFVQDNKADYDTGSMLNLCLSHRKIDKAVTVAIARDAVRHALRLLNERGEVSSLSQSHSVTSLQALIEAGYGKNLLAPEFRQILRTLEIRVQLDILLSAPVNSFLSHRDWILRHVAQLPKPSCISLADKLGPLIDAVNPAICNSAVSKIDDESSELMESTPAELVEFFLTLLLRTNQDEPDDDSTSVPALFVGNHQVPERYNQQSLELLLHDFASLYRPPIMITRCVDYENWNAAARLHEANGELVDAVECRLHSHQKVLLRSSSNRRLYTSNQLLAEEKDENDELQDNEQVVDDPLNIGVRESEEQRDEKESLRRELLSMINGFVLTTPSPAPSARLSSKKFITDTSRAAILARLVVKWFEYGLSRADLEVFLIDESVFVKVAAPLSRIFFGEIIERVGGKGLHSSTWVSIDDSDFDDRDKVWVRRCHSLPFSGQFLFHVCMWLLSHQQRTVDALEKPESTPILLDVVRENIHKNDLSVRAVRIEPQTAQSLGKSDPLETHVKAFSCGHVFPKRIFEEDVLPEFEKRMNTLPTPLFGTKQLLMSEFRRSHVEAPCPVCAFNRVSEMLFHGSTENTRALKDSHDLEQSQQTPYYFLHRSNGVSLPPVFGQPHLTHSQQQHDSWEWRSTTVTQ